MVHVDQDRTTLKRLGTEHTTEYDADGPIRVNIYDGVRVASINVRDFESVAYYFIEYDHTIIELTRKALFARLRRLNIVK